MFRHIFHCAILAICCTASYGEVAKEVLRARADGDNLLKSNAWRAYEKGFSREGNIFICDNGLAAGQRGLSQSIALNQKIPQPIIASVWSKAENIGADANSDYSLYLDLLYMDGDHLWGQVGVFSTGTHDWERREVRVIPDKPIKSVSVNLLLRRHSGKAMFRDPQLRQIEVPHGAGTFDGVPVILAPAAGGGFAVRDVAGDSDFVRFVDGQALGMKLETRSETRGRATFHTARLVNTKAGDRAITLIYSMPVKGDGWKWLADARTETPAQSPREYRWTGNGGRISRYPLAAIASAGEGRAVCLDMASPACFRVGFSAGSSELYIAYDLALTPERNYADVRFCTYRFDPAWGFRGAVAGMYEIYPDHFRSRTPQQGLWMPFAAISKVEGWEDFGFKFKEGNSETQWDDAHDILTFRYTEPMTWWMKMPKGMPRTIDAALAEAKRLANKGDRAAMALLTSGHHDERGQFVARLLDTPWCDGAVWSINSSPAIAGDVTDFKSKWNPDIRQKLYGPQRKGDLDGEYIDSSEGYVTAEYNYRRDHFAGAGIPLTFAPDSHRPAIFRGLIAAEYARALANDIHGMGKLMMANGAPHALCWLVPWLDVLGTETDWNPKNTWRPMSDAELMYRRILCGPKPYCFLMNSAFEDFSYELTEKYMKRCLAYGMFPGFFSHNASEGHYFTRKELYNRDRPLFKKYVPLCKRVAEAGWQPLSLARSSDPKVYVERFGQKYLTIFNDSTEKKTVTITLDGLKPTPGKELVRGSIVQWQNGQARLTLESEDVAVIELE